MASIVQRNKSYAVVYSEKLEGGSKQKWETYHSKEEAENRKWEIENAVPFLGIPPKLSSLSDLIKEYIYTYGEIRWSYSSYTIRISLINRYILPQIGNLKLSTINGRLLSRYFHKLYGLKPIDSKHKPSKTDILTGSTVYDIYKLLRSIFNQAVIWGVYNESPLKSVTIPKHISATRNILSMDQIKQIVSIATNQNTMLSIAIQLAFVGSLRKGEILALCWDDIDFEGGFVNVRKELIRVSVKSINSVASQKVIHVFPTQSSKCNTRLVFKIPKTPASIRKVFLPEALLRMLLCWKKEQEDKILSKLYNLIFTEGKGLPLQTEWVNKHFDKLLIEHNFPKVVFHSLRHSSTTYKLLISGGDLKSVQSDNGHVKPDMVLNVYARIQDEQRREMALQMEKAFYA
ncbi:tyrosine-type recombinase/integrase [Oscillibacter sp.]|uniref:tyrosine-type recombinase/integrase n=1 Tax=Oscillibacter sp. TaxID=1945593 RepID=UPI0028A0609D|nr:tyrosine-type recombinase/integrase [Oscillibacter sp.]